MFSKVIHKFYLIGGLLGLLVLGGYIQLAFFLHHESQSAMRAQQAVSVEREIHFLRNLFSEIRFWEKAVLHQEDPEADKNFGALMEQMSKRLADLKTKPIDKEIKRGLGEAFILVTEYEREFNRIIQNMTEQRLGQTLFDSNYQSLISNVLRSSEISLLRPLFNLSHFQKSYLSNHRESEYQALKVVMGSLESKLQQKEFMDDRLKGYIGTYKKILDNDFSQEKEIQKIRNHFNEISITLATHLSRISDIAEEILKKETQLAEGLRKRLNQSFIISMALGVIGIFLIFTLMARQIVNPIRAIANVARNVRLGDTATRFFPRGSQRDEVVLLGLDLNDMLDTLEKNNEQLIAYQEELEVKVRELEAAQAELVNKAVEAGRAQLSAMVLHNIGNAMTPVRVHVEGMKSKELEQIAGYLDKSYTDLCAHVEDLRRYVNDNPRGKEVFSFMGKLIDTLKDHTDQTRKAMGDIDRAVSYISDILTLQQSYAAREMENKEESDLNRLIDDAIRMQEGVLEQRGIHVNNVTDPNLPKLIIDKSRLVQVIVNLIKNSYESIDQIEDQKQEEHIIVKSFHDGGQVGFDITDSGAGITPAELSSICDFGNSNKGSSGFGLYYCKNFVEANNGTLTVSSPGKGKGSTVRVSFQT